MQSPKRTPYPKYKFDTIVTSCTSYVFPDASGSRATLVFVNYPSFGNIGQTPVTLSRLSTVVIRFEDFMLILTSYLTSHHSVSLDEMYFRYLFSIKT